jgi:predicted NBD/HSP70 family sugar kinase
MNLTGANLDHARRLNRRVVLEIVRVHGPLTRAEIARMAGLSAQTISNIADELCESSLLHAVRRPAGGRGQPTSDLALNPDGGFTFGISFDHNSLVVLLTDVAGTVRDSEHHSLKATAPDNVLPLIEQSVASLLQRQEVARDRVWGAGIVIPAILQNGELVALGPSSLPSWHGFPLRKALFERLGVPVLVENDATAAAIGERLYGAAKSLTDFVYIHIGAGIGGGLFLRGQPYAGGYGKSGEIGHMVVEPGGAPCPCGNRGCLERYASLNAAQAALGPSALGDDTIDIEAITAAFHANDPRLAAWIDLAAQKLRHGIVVLENCLDPQSIILGGVIPRPILEAIAAKLAPLPRSVSSNRPGDTPRVMLAQMGIDTPALGAATLPIFDGITPELSLLFKTGRVRTRAYGRQKPKLGPFAISTEPLMTSRS